jgi:protein-S-isoprenylcysteine O-methyltransferase Ste14
MAEKHTWIDTLIIVTTRVAGYISLLLFGAFLYFGAQPIVDMHLTKANEISWNTLLSVLFFLQHSGMVRRSLRARMAPRVPDHYQGVLYTLASGVVLTAVVVFWQPSGTLLVELQGFPRRAARGVFFIGAAGFAWGIHALKRFDAFGDARLKAHRRGIALKPTPFAVRGPYRWVRHPLYFFSLLLVWSGPDLTTDRLLFNVLWTAWIYIGTLLEEKDLRAEFGEKYRQYQRSVPMLVPLKRPAHKQHL